MNDRAQTDRACDAKELDGAWQIVINGASSGAYAGAVALFTRGGAVAFRRATGWAMLDPKRRPMTEETIFDLASLTKVVATLPSVLLLVAAGELALDDPVGRILPEFGIDGWRSAVTIRRLLSHSAGLPAWLPLYLDAAGPEAYLAAITQASPVAPPGDRVVYSDLGFILLGEIVRRLSGRDIARFAATEVFAPLGMGDTMFNPPATVRHGIAATEDGNQTEIGMCGDRAGEFPNWRRRTIWGEANDGNAFYGLSGIAGHAGLFGTATDLARYGRF